MQMQDDYIAEGFEKRCHELGVDTDALVKRALNPMLMAGSYGRDVMSDAVSGAYNKLRGNEGNTLVMPAHSEPKTDRGKLIAQNLNDPEARNNVVGGYLEDEGSKFKGFMYDVAPQGAKDWMSAGKINEYVEEKYPGYGVTRDDSGKWHVTEPGAKAEGKWMSNEDAGEKIRKQRAESQSGSDAGSMLGAVSQFMSQGWQGAQQGWQDVGSPFSGGYRGQGGLPSQLGYYAGKYGPYIGGAAGLYALWNMLTGGGGRGGRRPPPRQPMGYGYPQQGYGQYPPRRGGYTNY